MDRHENSPNRNGLQSSEHKAGNVTSLNYHDKAKVFMQGTQKETGEFGKLIDPSNQPQLWGAWKAYFLKIGKRGTVTRMGSIEGLHETFKQPKTDKRASTTYVVPASMPSDFDEGQDWYSDTMAGDKFIAHQEVRRANMANRETAEHRKAVVDRVLGRSVDRSATYPKPGRIDNNWKGPK